MQHNQYVPKLFFAMLILLLLCSCSKPEKSEKEIVSDLQESPSFFSAGGELTITDYEITKRRTAPENFSDTVYITIAAENADIHCSLSYIVHYELYNDGWVLDNIQSDPDGTWMVTPLHGMTDEELQEKLDRYISSGLYDSVEVISRETDLTETGCNETATLLLTKDHKYGTETFRATQTWFFHPSWYIYTGVSDPAIIERSVDLKDTIIGRTWTCNRYYNSFSAWPDKFEFEVCDLYEENGKVWVKFSIHRNRNTYWDAGSSEPTYYGMTTDFVVSTYLKYLESEGMWAFNLEDGNEYLYSEDDNERFTRPCLKNKSCTKRYRMRK